MGNAKPDQVSLFLSITAVVTAVVFFPVVLVLHFTNTETISQPVPWNFLAGSSSIGVGELANVELSIPLKCRVCWCVYHRFEGCLLIFLAVFNFLLNFGVAYTYPLFIAFGGIVGIPLNHGMCIWLTYRRCKCTLKNFLETLIILCLLVADWYFRNNAFDATKAAGTVLIIAGFILIVSLPVNVDNQFHTWVTTRILKRRLVEAPEETVELKRLVVRIGVVFKRLQF